MKKPEESAVINGDASATDGTRTENSPRVSSAPSAPRIVPSNGIASKTIPSRSDNCFSRVVLTDWLVYPGSGDNPRSEILEFAWAVFDLNSESILEKVRHMLRPTENDRNNVSQDVLQQLRLSDCRPLEHAKSLKQVLTEFDTACSMVTPPSVCVVVSSAKLRDQLLTETFRKALSVPKCLRGVLDLATLASHFYPTQFTSLSESDLVSPRAIATHLGTALPSIAEEFASTEGCIYMAESVKKMHKDNINFEPQHLSTVITAPAEPDIAAALLPGRMTEFVVKLRGVPWDVSEQDLIRFVEPVCQVTTADVHIVTNFEGRSTGEVFVRLPSMALRDKCLAELHGCHLGKRWIEVFKASETDLITFSSFKGAEALEKRGALRLRGLPYSTNEYEVVKFFMEGGFQLDINSVVLGQSRENRLSGDAWVLVESPQTAEDARRELHKKTIGRRYIELFQSTPREVEMAKRGHIPPGRISGYDRPSPYSPPGHGWMGRGGYGMHHHHPAVLSYHHQLPVQRSVGERGGQGALAHTPVLRMRGLPYYANENHIVEFFHGFTMAAILPATAPIDGRPSGEAYVEFVSVDEAWRALKTRQGAMMDRRYIELFPAAKQEMDFAAAGMDPREIRSRCPRL